MSAVQGAPALEGLVPEAGSGRARVSDSPAPRRGAGPLLAVTRLPGFVLRLGLGLAATLVVSVRAQLAILERYPEADWLALAGGLLAGGLVLFAAVAVAFGLRSPRRALVLMTALPALLLTAGCLSVTHFPEAGFRTGQLRGEWERLHPTLRLSLWIARLSGDLVLTDVAGRPAGHGVTGLPEPGVPGRFPRPWRGYVQAVDLRARDPGELRDWARQGLFLALGLKAVPHAGAAGHLHVSLPSRPR